MTNMSTKSSLTSLSTMTSASMNATKMATWFPIPHELMARICGKEPAMLRLPLPLRLPPTLLAPEEAEAVAEAVTNAAPRTSLKVSRHQRSQLAATMIASCCRLPQLLLPRVFSQPKLKPTSRALPQKRSQPLRLPSPSVCPTAAPPPLLLSNSTANYRLAKRARLYPRTSGSPMNMVAALIIRGRP